MSTFVPYHESFPWILCTKYTCYSVVKGTVHQYWSRAITHISLAVKWKWNQRFEWFYGTCIKMAHNIHGQVGRPWGSIQEDITAWINVSVFKWNVSKGHRFHWLNSCFLHIADNIALNTYEKSLLGLYLGWFTDKHTITKNFQKR